MKRHVVMLKMLKNYLPINTGILKFQKPSLCNNKKLPNAFSSLRTLNLLYNYSNSVTLNIWLKHSEFAGCAAQIGSVSTYIYIHVLPVSALERIVEEEAQMQEEQNWS